MRIFNAAEIFKLITHLTFTKQLLQDDDTY